MNLSAPVKTLATLLVVAFLLPMAPMLHAQTRLPPDGHLRLIVHNGTGDGDSYYVGQTVPVGAQTPSGFEFVKWFKTEGDGSLSAPLQADGNFIMGRDNSEIAATFAKLESWFPPGPEGNTKGLLLPKPQSGQARRLEQRIRITLNRGSSTRPPYSEVWGALRVKMKWKEATNVRFFTAEIGGQEIANEDVLPKDSFKPKAENVYEASIWYEGNLTQEQIAQMSQSGNTPKVTIQMNFVVEGNDKPISWTGALLPVQIKATSNGFPPTGLPGKYSSTPEKGSVDNLISVWPAEELKITIDIPEPFKSNPPAGLISWNAPDHTVPDQTTEFTFSWLDTGTKTIQITIGGSTFKVVVDVPNVGNISQGDALLALDPITAASVVAFGIEAMNYSNDPANFPSVVPKKDAIRHSYWTALCASDSLVNNSGVLFVTTAHEHNNKWEGSSFGGSTAPQQAFNSTMDLRNNLIGIATSHMTGIGTPDRAAILQDLNQQYQQGLMWIYDGSTSEAASEGILSKSNRQKIYPP